MVNKTKKKQIGFCVFILFTQYTALWAANEPTALSPTESTLFMSVLCVLLLIAVVGILYLCVKHIQNQKADVRSQRDNHEVDDLRREFERRENELLRAKDEKQSVLEEKIKLIETLSEEKKELEGKIIQIRKKNQELENTLIQKNQENDIVCRETARKIFEAENKLQEVEKVHNSFFTQTVHEMRAPLSIVLGTLNQITQKSDLDADVSTQLLSAYRNALSMQDLADQLIDTRSSGLGASHPRVARYDMVAIVQQVCDLFIDWIAMNKVDFRLVTQIPNIWMWFDRRKFEFALRVLLTNSLRNTFLYGKVLIDISIERINGKGFCAITIRDDGLNEEESMRRGMKQITEMAESLGGSFVTTEIGDQGGTKCVLMLPLGKQPLMDCVVEFIEPETDLIRINAAQKDEISELIHVTSQKKQTGKKLLIIDDSDQIRWFLKHVFNKEYHILEARNGEEGVRTAYKEDPDVILCDVMMPVKDGFETCKELKADQRTSQIPIIMLTAKVESEDVITGIESGADDYITKPFEVEILRSKVNSLLKRREQLKQYFSRSLFVDANSSDNTEEEDDGFMNAVIKTIEKNLDDPKFEAKVLADSMNMSLPTLYRKIKMYSDCSILELTRSVRLKKAAELILQQRFSIQEVSEMVGFNDTATFRKRFTEQYGVTPYSFAMSKRKD